MKGFTLIEVLIYSAILVIILGGILVTFYSILGTSDSLRYRIELVENSKFLEQKFRWAITGAAQIDSPVIGGTSATLSLNKPGVANPLIFDLDNGMVRIASGSETPIPLTNSFVIVTSLSFENYSFSGNTQNTVRVRVDLESRYVPVRATTSIDLFISVQ